MKIVFCVLRFSFSVVVNKVTIGGKSGYRSFRILEISSSNTSWDVSNSDRFTVFLQINAATVP